MSEQYRYRLQRKEPYSMPNILGNHSMPVHTYRWKEIPATDVVYVKHGHWILVDIEKGTGVCSNCNRQDHIDGLAAYCRFCGTKMDDVGRE